MKRIIGLFCLIYAGTACWGQSHIGGEAMIGMDIFHAVTACDFRITVMHSFCGKWSAGAGARVTPFHGHESSDKEERLHDMLLSRDDGRHDGTEEHKTGHIGSISFRYWPSGAFDGAYIGTGMMTGENIGTGFTTGAGYLIRLWKGLCLNLGFEVCLNGKSLKAAEMTNGIEIGINYIF